MANDPSATNAPSYGQAVDHARQLLRDAVLRGQLAPGAVFSQGQLAETLGVGRTPLREAIRVVGEEGLLVSEPRRRIRVADMSVDDLEELYALRITVEAVGVRATLPSMTAEDLAELQGLAAKMEHFAGLNDFERYEIPHRAFHSLLVAALPIRFGVISDQLFDHSERYRRAYLKTGESPYEPAVAEHRAMVAAALERDSEACVAALAAHYARTVANVVAEIAPDAELPHFELACAVALTRARTALGRELVEQALASHGVRRR